MSDKSKKPWHHLPNAALIDRVLAHLQARTEVWAAVLQWADQRWYPEREKECVTAWEQAWDEAYETQGLAWDWTRPEMAGHIRPVRHAILALIAWPDCGYLLHTDPSQVKVLALLGHPPAVLLYPACRALQKSSQINNLQLLSFG